MAKVLARFFHFFLGHDKSKVQGYLVEEGDIRLAQSKLDRILIQGFDPLNRGRLTVNEILGPFDPYIKTGPRAAGVRVKDAGQGIDHIVGHNLPAILELNTWTQFEGVDGGIV